MRLVRAEIEGYRSIREPLQFFLDSSTTVIVGANDHGKSNLLSALTHLNSDHPFAEDDLNWDDADDDRAADRPRVSAVFQLTRDERTALQELETAHRESKVESSPVAETSQDAAANEESTDTSKPPEAVRLKEIPEQITLMRVGLRGKAAAGETDEVSSEALVEFVASHLPSIELIDLSGDLSDSVTFEELADGSNEFMRGIFYYAGLNQDQWQKVFTQNPQTERQLDEASDRLNANLKANWSQGANLTFRLRHDSAKKQIGLRIEDPSVRGRYVHASQRSSGFTHFFKLKTVLHARQREAQAQSYVWLFDEPGVNLHPDGQRDLMKALETIARTNQVGYCTHSIFLINSNFPTRHRLLVKNESGTRIDGKPFQANWKRAIEALGLAVPGTILFASHVLLTEGDSDPIYIPAVLQKLTEWELFQGDLNSVSVMGTGEAKNADAIVRWLTETAVAPKIGYLVDGDEGGSARLRRLDKLLKEKGIPALALGPGRAIEDHLPFVEELYLPAVASYTARIAESEKKKPKTADELLAVLRKEFAKRQGDEPGLASWALSLVASEAHLDEKPSKVGVAREYVDALRAFAPESKPARKDLRLPLELVATLNKLLPLPNREAPEGEIVGDVQPAKRDANAPDSAPVATPARPARRRARQ